MYNRRKQYFLLKYILENNIKHWEELNLEEINNLFIKSNKKFEFVDIVNLPYFNNWLVGFTAAEGSFHIKARGTAHFSIVQSGIENYHLIKAIHYFFKGPESFNYQIKPENFEVYRISFSSKKDLNLIINFFDTNNLLGLKKLQFDSWKSYIISKINDSAPNVILSKVSNNNNDNNNNINDSRPLPFALALPKHTILKEGLNKNYLNLIYGLLLGKSFIFNNCRIPEIKIIIEIEGKHLSYIMDIQKKISSLGYCPFAKGDKMPLIKTKILKKGNLSKVMQLHTYNNNNYLELYSKWYLDKHNKNIPNDINHYFNAESLAYWLMTEGKISNKKLFVNMTKFNEKDIKFFIQFLENKFNLDQINLNNYWLEFNSNNIKKIYNITKPYIFSSMKFKFLTKESDD